MQALYICLLNPSKRKDLDVLNLQKVGFEVVKCDKHSSLDQLDRTEWFTVLATAKITRVLL